MRNFRAFSALLALAGLASAVRADFSYTQNFDGMGTGTTAPTGWSVYSIAGSHDQFKPADDPSGTGGLPTSAAISGGTANATLLAATADTSTTQKSAQGYNWGVGGSTTNRSLGTSPTGIAAMVLQLSLTNNSGAAITDLSISYDVLVQSVTTNNNNITTNNYVGIEELPGYWLWYSLDGGANYTNVASLNGNGHTWANAIGTVNEAIADLTLSSPWNDGASIRFRWVDDNAQGPSPDQRLGLENVSIQAVPEPASLAVLTLGAVALMARRRRV